MEYCSTGNRAWTSQAIDNAIVMVLLTKVRPFCCPSSYVINCGLCCRFAYCQWKVKDLPIFDPFHTYTCYVEATPFMGLRRLESFPTIISPSSIDANGQRLDGLTDSQISGESPPIRTDGNCLPRRGADFFAILSHLRRSKLASIRYRRPRRQCEIVSL
ncbi:hypothetical protein TTRE_0000601401 [Trichuris trichiura]|uniref:Uncharacterized protein n=1 Tax=Trichuris trichiura TaxID=36087 RepID=A0A077ZBH9_TRITR|nr:hypothetical protein TTRE_0000601401 [Trichuris trichiura]